MFFLCVFFWGGRGIHFYKLVTNCLFFCNKCVKIQDGCQPWPLIAITKTVRVTFSNILKQLVPLQTWKNVLYSPSHGQPFSLQNGHEWKFWLCILSLIYQVRYITILFTIHTLWLWAIALLIFSWVPGYGCQRFCPVTNQQHECQIFCNVLVSVCDTIWLLSKQQSWEVRQLITYVCDDKWYLLSYLEMIDLHK